MASSTSSSEHAAGGVSGLSSALALVIRVCWQTVVVAAAIVIAAELLFRLDPSETPEDLESLVLREQQVRASTLDATDIVIVGDSSGLMDLDGERLTALLNRRVESLAAVGFAGPRGFAALLSRYANRYPPRVVVLVLHGETMRLTEQTFQGLGLEEQARSGKRLRPALPGVGARRKLYEWLVSPLTDFPLPGAYGTYYGMPAELRRQLWRGHGTVVDPTRTWSDGRGVNYVFTLSDAVRARLPSLDSAVPFPATLLVVVAPVPASVISEDTAPSRERAIAQLIDALGPRWHLLETPMSLDDRQFANLTHLNADGRRDFTERTGKVLRGALDR